MMSSAFAHTSKDPHDQILRDTWKMLNKNESKIALSYINIPGIGTRGDERVCTNSMTDLKVVAPSLWSGVSRIVDMSSDVVLIVKMEYWHVPGIIDGTTACYDIYDDVNLGNTALNDQIKAVGLDCFGDSSGRKTVTLLQHDITRDPSKGDGDTYKLLHHCN